MYLLFIFIAALIIGVLAGVFLQGGIISCTEMYCMCEGQGEVECNSCVHENPVFALAIINVIDVCDAREILICKNNEPIERKYSLEGACYRDVRWFDFVLSYME